MIVLLDLEWVEKNETNLTQLSAMRVDGNWSVTGCLDLIVKPSASCLREADHIAFGGYSTKLFEGAFSVDECMPDFLKWLEPEDNILVWSKSNIKVLNELLNVQAPLVEGRITSVAKVVRKAAASNGNAFESPYGKAL